MPKRLNGEEESVIHVHDWKTRSYDLSADFCKCGKVRVSQAEFNRRAAECLNYFKLVETTEAYRIFQEMRVAWKEKNLARVKELHELVKTTRCDKVSDIGNEDVDWVHKVDYLSKPNFPDPATWTGYETII